VRFQVFRNGEVMEKFRVCGAYMFGTDGTSIRRTKISFSNGFVECQKPNSETAGLALLWPIDGFGRVLLPTTCLPERDRPYCLNVEIARARLMQTISRREDWSMFDGTAELEDISKQAQDQFIKAVQHMSDPAAASQLADSSLRKAVVFSEKLSTTQAEALFKTRIKSNGLGRACMGCRIEPRRIGQAGYVDRAAQIADFAVIPVNWAEIESKEGVFDFSQLDVCVEELSRKHLILGIGPLLRFTKEAIPSWLQNGQVSFTKVREAAYQFVTELVSRYRRKVNRWFVVSGLNAFNHFGLNVEQVLEMTRAANMAVKSVNSRAFRLIEVTNLWGEYYATTPNSIAPVAYMDMVVQSGITFDAFSLQMRFGKNQSGMHIRDMMQISSLLDYFSMMGKPLYVTGIEIPSRNGTGASDGRVAGVWHKEWDTKRQALWLDQFHGIALSKPCVDAVVYGCLADSEDSVVPNSGLLTDELEPKDSFRILRRLREAIRNP
jgi:hypothetical protein